MEYQKVLVNGERYNFNESLFFFNISSNFIAHYLIENQINRSTEYV